MVEKRRRKKKRFSCSIPIDIATFAWSGRLLLYVLKSYFKRYRFRSFRIMYRTLYMYSGIFMYFEVYIYIDLYGIYNLSPLYIFAGVYRKPLFRNVRFPPVRSRKPHSPLPPLSNIYILLASASGILTIHKDQPSHALPHSSTPPNKNLHHPRLLPPPPESSPTFWPQ